MRITLIIIDFYYYQDHDTIYHIPYTTDAITYYSWQSRLSTVARCCPRGLVVNLLLVLAVEDVEPPAGGVSPCYYYSPRLARRVNREYTKKLAYIIHTSSTTENCVIHYTPPTRFGAIFH